MFSRTLFFIPLAVLIGCSGGADKPPAPKAQKPVAAAKADESAEIKTERAKLSPEDRELVDAQEWCSVTEERLGSMGAPIKLTIKDKAVFICCAGCKKKAEADPDKTLAKVEELKARKKANPPK